MRLTMRRRREHADPPCRRPAKILSVIARAGLAATVPTVAHADGDCGVFEGCSPKPSTTFAMADNAMANPDTFIGGALVLEEAHCPDRLSRAFS
ncbi:hypothetical protein [Streptomyces roseochromogenus]|uniref:Uncharacterized protein n=1 Tax=Streptomyces roseochromogenus subsp. oscitans DS 12.976 TaxID=1352936 RepID=V6KVG0_STRRC|nr:hypothetical protein [Streptomyces roseochromogenus]EST36127.1 hypothetical protein M878_03225 [Streptomyces roseochromogenus subsp. oscitans DS 12.976]